MVEPRPPKNRMAPGTSLAVVYSRALAGADAPEVAVEVHLQGGLPAFLIVGLPDAEVRESRDRVRTAILTSGFDFPARKIIVSLAPADLPKGSGRFDLPIALGILVASGQVLPDLLASFEFAGELALGGQLRPVRGALAMAWHARLAGRAFILPEQSAPEAALIEGVRVFGAGSLLQVCAHLNHTAALAPCAPVEAGPAAVCADLAEVKGLLGARHALEVAAAGGHSLLLLGPPGTGKSMLAACLPGLLPPMRTDEALESAALQSLSRQGFCPQGWRVRPFRAPHHSSSLAALVGGGSIPQPGEITLAHLGVLFLDELPEFDRRVLEALREPLETGVIHIARVAHHVCFPARFQLVAAMNPCPCGYFGHVSERCRCTPEQILRYRGKISGPLLDRIDLQVEVPPPDPAVLIAPASGESSATVRARVADAYARQLQRQGKVNAMLSGMELERCGYVEPSALDLLADLLARLSLSARGYHRILRVARTIADLEQSELALAAHVLQAVQLRRGAGFNK